MSRRVGLQNAVRAAVFVGALHVASPTLGLGLGEMELRSFLNEPLQAEVALFDLRGLTADDIRVRLGAVEDFNRLGVERSYFLTGIEFEVVVDSATGRGVIRLRTDAPVLEPYIDLIIEARWPTGRLLRNYTVLVDPPAFSQEVLTVSASEEVRRTEEPPPPAPQPESPATADTESTSVSLRESDLAPGAMPDRPFSAATSPEPSAGSRYMVKRDETLWQIASRGRPSETSVQQAMLDIQRLNPEAFIDGNINRIKAGYIIYLPASGEISSDDLASALEEVRQQNEAFETFRTEPGVTAAATLRVSADPVADADVSEDLSEASSTRAGTRADGTSDSTSSAVTAREDEAPTDSGSDTASAELAAQLDAMASRLDTLEQIVALKDEQIATLEQALREAREAAEIAAASPGSAALPPQSTVTAPPAAPPANTTPERPAPAAGLPMWPLFAGIAAIIGLLVFAVLRRRRAQSDADEASMGADAEDDVFAGVSLRREALDAELEGAAADADDELAGDDEPAPDDEEARPVPAVAATGSRGYGERKHDDYIDEGAGGDALAEADIYIAYGRYLQAIELLNTAIEDEPGNSAYRLKLIELYVDMGEEAAAEKQLRELRASGDEEAISRAESLVGGGLRPIEYEVPVRDPEADAASEKESDWAPRADDAAMPDLEYEPESKPAEPPEPAEDEPGAALDLDDEGEDPGAAEPDDSDFLRGEELQGEPMEFDDLQIEEDDESEDDPEERLQIGERVTGEIPMELDLEGDGEDELDLSEALSDARMELAEESNGDSEELLIAEDADQMATKLDLARAYLDMGDGAGAKVILEEVIGGGTGEQQQEARELLSRID